MQLFRRVVGMAKELSTYTNDLAHRDCQKLYLNVEAADVFFLLEEGQKKVPAHKNILSALSRVFERMFSDTFGQKGVVQIDDFSADAFKAFLQFFYLTTVQLTSANALEVMSLGNRFAVNNCLNACKNFCQTILTTHTMCWGYELAIMHEWNELREFCEQKINEHPQQIFGSLSFLLCDSSLLRHILQLKLNCAETVVFDGCIAWARAACIQNNVDEKNGQNLRKQLDELIYEIRFGEMKIPEFYARYNMYRGLFSVEEFEEIINIITRTNIVSSKFNQNPRNKEISAK